MKTKTRFALLRRALVRDINFIKALYVVIILAITTVVFFSLVQRYINTGQKVTEIFESKDCILENAVFEVSSTQPEIKQLKEQFLVIAEIKNSYLFMAEKYSAFNYTFSIFLTLFSIISGILGFIILKKGWDNIKNYYLKASFLIAFFCSTLFGVMPSVFSAKENIKNNLTKYYFYSGLQVDIYGLAKDNKGYLKRNTPQSLDSLNLEINAINQKIKENQNLYFDINIDKIPKEVKPF
ncbi:MAG: hypothetical protein HRT68_04620 [Flavobacteriaceae bacterium]|nr:hypothetical protein [Flavobacteriaceae bacterium]